MLEEHYMIQIWGIVNLKENQNLTTKEQQDLIIKKLSEMRKDVEGFAKKSIKKEIKDEIDNILEKL